MFLPERDATDASKLHFSFQHLLYLSFLGSLLHLLSSNQIDALGCQDHISLDGLGCDKKKRSENCEQCQKGEQEWVALGKRSSAKSNLTCHVF